MERPIEDGEIPFNFTGTPTSIEALWGHGLEVRSSKTSVALTVIQLSQQ